MDVFQLLYCLVYSYWPIRFKFLLLSNFQLYCFLTIFVTTFRFFSKSLEEERLDRSKYREYLSRLFAVLLLLTVNWCLLKQQDLDTVIIIKVTRTV